MTRGWAALLRGLRSPSPPPPSPCSCTCALLLLLLLLLLTGVVGCSRSRSFLNRA